ncbi:MAG: lysylphosphatidylglycerol synthase transmembrane domain-containing protein [Balneolaceae bacterium]
MTKRYLNILVSIVVAGLFIWLAVRNVDMADVWVQMQTVTFYWLPPFILVLFTSHFLRAERWRLLLKKEQRNIPRSTLFAGVMLGYMLNNIVPRLGEVSRPVYVAKKHDLSSGNMLGTIVLERIIDVCTMLLLMVFIAFYISRDFGMLEQIFGIESWSFYTYLIIPVIILFLIAGIIIFYKLLVWIDSKQMITNPFLQKIIKVSRSFGEGMISIKHVDNWPLFLLLTAGIWVGYIAMTYIPFYMLDLQGQFGLNLADAIVLTLVSSIGVSIPTPAGIGSYHLLIQQSMWLLYSVPLATALTYATVTHAATVLLIFMIAPLALWWDKYYTLKTADTR